MGGCYLGRYWLAGCRRRRACRCVQAKSFLEVVHRGTLHVGCFHSGAEVSGKIPDIRDAVNLFDTCVRGII